MAAFIMYFDIYTGVSQRRKDMMSRHNDNRGCKLQGSLYGLSHDWHIGFITKLKLSG